MRRGQASIFIILGILMLFIFSIVFFLGDFSAGEPNNFNGDIHAYVQGCFEESIEDSLNLIGHNGGYSNVPKLISWHETSFWFSNGTNIQPTLDEIKLELESYIIENFGSCINEDAISSLGYSIEAGEPLVNVSFLAEDVWITMDYPFKAFNGHSSTVFREFNHRENLRLRRIYETASQIINLQMSPSFDSNNPLDGLVSDFDVHYSVFDSSFLYTIQGGSSFGKPFAFRLGTEEGFPSLDREVSFSGTSYFPFIIYSVDRNAQLNILPATSAFVGGELVSYINVDSVLLKNVTRYDVPMHELADNSVLYGDITWNLSYPVYNFTPDGLLFSYPQRLALYWDPQNQPLGKIGILSNHDGGWKPVPVVVDYDNNVAYTDISGFSSYSLADCGLQGPKYASAEAKVDPGSGCWFTVVAVAIVLIVATIFTFGGFALAGGAVGGGIASGVSFSAAIAGNSIGTILAAGTSSLMTMGSGAAMAAVIAGGIIGGGLLTGAVADWGAGDDSISFVPTCDQFVTITSSGDGDCYPSGTIEVGAGKTVNVKAILKKCDSGGGLIPCGECEQKCSVKYY